MTFGLVVVCLHLFVDMELEDHTTLSKLGQGRDLTVMTGQLHMVPLQIDREISSLVSRFNT